MTPEEHAESFARIVAKTRKVYGHADSFANVPRAHDAGTIWDINAVHLITSPLFPRGRLFAFDALKDPSPFPWPKVEWPEPC